MRYPREVVGRAVLGCRRDQLVDVGELQRFEDDAGAAELDPLDHDERVCRMDSMLERRVLSV